jgi:hypothetical protein
LNPKLPEEYLLVLYLQAKSRRVRAVIGSVVLAKFLKGYLGARAEEVMAPGLGVPPEVLDGSLYRKEVLAVLNCLLNVHELYPQEQQILYERLVEECSIMKSKVLSYGSVLLEADELRALEQNECLMDLLMIPHKDLNIFIDSFLAEFDLELCPTMLQWVRCDKFCIVMNTEFPGFKLSDIRGPKICHSSTWGLQDVALLNLRTIFTRDQNLIELGGLRLRGDMIGLLNSQAQEPTHLTPAICEDWTALSENLFSSIHGNLPEEHFLLTCYSIQIVYMVAKGDLLPAEGLLERIYSILSESYMYLQVHRVYGPKTSSQRASSEASSRRRNRSLRPLNTTLWLFSTAIESTATQEAEDTSPGRYTSSSPGGSRFCSDSRTGYSMQSSLKNCTMQPYSPRLNLLSTVFKAVMRRRNTPYSNGLNTILSDRSPP